MASSFLLALALAGLSLYYFILEPLIFSSLARVPGPKLFALTKWRLALEDWKGTRTRKILALHEEYGPVVRIGPTEVSFNSMSALRTIYGPGSQYGRTTFYRMFDVYGEQNLFTLHSTKDHGDRKKLLSHAYSKSSIYQERAASMVEEKVNNYMKLLETQPGGINDIFASLHYFSLDSITSFIYGVHGATSATQGNQAHRSLIDDIMDPSRRRLFWFLVHLSVPTRWLYAQAGSMERLIKPFLPMQKPSTYIAIRAHALKAFQDFRLSAEKHSSDAPEDYSILGLLWKHHESQKEGGLTDMKMASECADHFLAGIDTTSDTLMFLIWALSLPDNQRFQEKLRKDILNLPSESLNRLGYPSPGSSDKSEYLAAVIKETLRLYAPLPSTEFRSMSTDSAIDGYTIPGNTVVGMSPYILHRNPDVFEEPALFDPERWLRPGAQELERWFWGFSSGGRMCVGRHLAMAEMTTLIASIYSKYRTTIAPGFEDTTPAITARVEIFYDERFPIIQENKCLIHFQKL
ncbi:cytochrome P450 [Plectosphaerella plurivora]|uniref:Cytochrome P450 n=1 Tax=Plectosphaerella plurivora TaxID=936078 RepID=A0A9P8VK98_9PEZI|nr:cytochrome P450 [Plectosphaerella plurivora]